MCSDLHYVVCEHFAKCKGTPKHVIGNNFRHFMECIVELPCFYLEKQRKYSTTILRCVVKSISKLKHKLSCVPYVHSCPLNTAVLDQTAAVEKQY